jgi:hypothetical protein
VANERQTHRDATLDKCPSVVGMVELKPVPQDEPAVRFDP